MEWHNADIGREERLVVSGWERKREGGVGKEMQKRKDMSTLFNEMVVDKKRGVEIAQYFMSMVLLECHFVGIGDNPELGVVVVVDNVRMVAVVVDMGTVDNMVIGMMMVVVVVVGPIVVESHRLDLGFDSSYNSFENKPSSPLRGEVELRYSGLKSIDSRRGEGD